MASAESRAFAAAPLTHKNPLRSDTAKLDAEMLAPKSDCFFPQTGSFGFKNYLFLSVKVFPSIITLYCR